MHTSAEIKAAAESAIAARAKATAAHKAADEAGGVDEELNHAAAAADTEAKDADAKAAALSQSEEENQKRIDRMRRKRDAIDRELRANGAGDADDDEEGDEIDPDRPLTLKDLQRIDAGKAKKSAEAMADALPDAEERAAVRDALVTRINPALVASNPAAAFGDARALVNQERNAKIIEEAQRRRAAPARAHGAGSPPRAEEAFEPTAEEARYMRPPFSMTQAEILAARGN